MTAIFPLLDDPDKRQNSSRSLAFGSWCSSAISPARSRFRLPSRTAESFPPAFNRAFLELGNATLQYDFPTALVKGIFAGWIIALLVWLLPTAEGSRVSVIIILTYVVGLGSLSHVIAGAVEAFYAAVVGAASWTHVARDFLLPVFLGNSIGGVLLVSLLNYAQVAVKSEEETTQ